MNRAAVAISYLLATFLGQMPAPANDNGIWPVLAVRGRP
jgi:hypothetical protein